MAMKHRLGMTKARKVKPSRVSRRERRTACGGATVCATAATSRPRFRRSPQPGCHYRAYRARTQSMLDRMLHVTLRLYAELNDFVPANRRHRTLTVALRER